MNGRRLLKFGRLELVDLAATTALTMVATAGFRSSFGGWFFLVVGAVATAVGGVLGHLFDRLRPPAAFALLAAIVAMFVTGSAAAAREDVLAGVVPTPAAFRAFLDGLVAGWRRILTVAPPSGNVGNVLAVVFFCAYVCALGTLLLSRRRERLSALLVLPGVALATSVLFGDRKPFSVLVQGAGFAALAVGWLALRRSRERKHIIHSTGRSRIVGAVAMVATMGIVGFVVGPALPFAEARSRFVLRPLVDPPFDPREFGSPLNSFQRFLIGDLKDRSMFTIEGLPADAPQTLVRLAVMDDYDGVVWRVSPRSGTQGGRFVRVGETVPVVTDGDDIRLSVRIEDLPGVWLPGVGDIEKVGWTTGGQRARDAREQFRLSTVTSTGIVPVAGGWREGDSYELTAVVPEIGETDVVDSDIDKQVVTDLTRPAPEALRSVTAAITKGKVRPYDQVAAIQQYLRAGYYASGDKDKDELNAPGHSYGRLIKFLENDQPIGNAEQYAAAMAIMVRSLDIPARVVMGFRVRAGQTEVTGANVHAWVEVGFEDGWVTFDPTSTREEKPKNEQKQPKPFFESQNVPPPPLVPLEPDVNARQTGANDKPKPPKDKPKTTARKTDRTALVVASVGLGVPTMAFVSTGSVIVGLKRRRRRRRRRLHEMHDRIAGGWAELLDAARDIGLPLPQKGTRHEVALMLGTEGAVALAAQADSAVFGGNATEPDVVEHYWHQVDEARRGLFKRVPFLTRLRAKISLNSLRR